MEDSDSKLRPGDIVGKTGLEQQYNDTLMGTDGLRRVIVNSIGKEVGRLEQQDAIPGKPIQLTIDYDLQAAAEAALNGRREPWLCIDPRTGEVLAMVSRPAYDPNDFAVRISRDQWAQLNEDPDRPLLNRAIQAQLAPGSVFKIIMATAMLESKVIPENFTVFCPGYANVLRPHVPLLGQRAMARWICIRQSSHSCDVFFYNVGKTSGHRSHLLYAMRPRPGPQDGY